MLEAQHLVKRFFGISAVSDVSFEVRGGEVVGYLGPNGSGKSTTAKMLTGLLETSSGEVFWNGTAIARDLVAFHARLGTLLKNRISTRSSRRSNISNSSDGSGNCRRGS